MSNRKEHLDWNWYDSCNDWSAQPFCLEDIERGMKIVSRAYLLEMPKEIPDKKYTLSNVPHKN
jgi:hypothetical protein